MAISFMSLLHFKLFFFVLSQSQASNRDGLGFLFHRRHGIRIMVSAGHNPSILIAILLMSPWCKSRCDPFSTPAPLRYLVFNSPFSNPDNVKVHTSWVRRAFSQSKMGLSPFRAAQTACTLPVDFNDRRGYLEPLNHLVLTNKFDFTLIMNQVKLSDTLADL